MVAVGEGDNVGVEVGTPVTVGEMVALKVGDGVGNILSVGVVISS